MVKTIKSVVALMLFPTWDGINSQTAMQESTCFRSKK